MTTKFTTTIKNNIPVQVNVQKSPTVIAKVTGSARGKSAYEIWIDEGHIGTPAEFLSWLRQDSFVHNHLAVDSSWTITHNLGKKPSVTVVDSAENWVIGDVVYINDNELVVSFSSAFSGRAYLN